MRSIKQGRRASARRLHARQAGQRGQSSRRQRSIAMMMMMMVWRGGGCKVQTRVRVQEWVLLLLLRLLLRLLHRRVQSFGTVAVWTW